jgi:hypothetical protein
MTKGRNAPKKQRRNMRKRARLDFLDKIDSPFGKCHWCGITILWRIRIPKGWSFEYVVRPVTARVSRGPGQTVEVYNLATIDHVKSLAEGGGNHPFNLVAACTRCNSHRNKSLANCLRH